MRFELLALAATAAGVLASPSRETLISTNRAFARKCGTPDPSPHHRAMSAQFAAAEAERSRAQPPTKVAAAAQEMITVETYFHVVAASEDAEGGWVNDTQIEDQFTKLSGVYGPLGIQLALVETTRTVNADWANQTVEQSTEMRTSLRKGTYSTLNLYLVQGLGDNITLGYCDFPTYVAPDSDAFIRDGCAVLSSTLPDGTFEPYNLGATAVHEIGHWFGLFHTFGTTCNADADQISDTPIQLDATDGCPVGKDTCPGQPGKDAIHNYMDYSDDACLNAFTDGQAERMFSNFRRYREGR